VQLANLVVSIMRQVGLTLPIIVILSNCTCVDCVDSFKLLGVHISDTVSWDDHVNAVCLKTGKCLFFLKLLKRSSVSVDDLLRYYEAVIRKVSEYDCPIWHQFRLTAEQRERLETIHRRAMRIQLLVQMTIRATVCRA
jgi:hypothetical protein